MPRKVQLLKKVAAFIEVVPFQATNETLHFLRILLDFFSSELISFPTADAKSYQTKFSTSYLQAFTRPCG